MRNLKRAIAMIISLVMVFSMFATLCVFASETEYKFYTSVGSTFVPNTNATTEGITWTNGDTAVDTSVMGRRIMTGTDASGNVVKGIVNVGVQKYSAYVNAEDKTAGEGLTTTAPFGQWKQSGSVASYVSKERVAGVPNMAVSYNAFNANSPSTTDQRNSAISCSLADANISSDFESSFRVAIDGGQTEIQATMVFKDANSKAITIVIKRNSDGTYAAKLNGATITGVKNDSQWVWLKVTYTNQTNTFSLYDLNDNGKFIHRLVPDGFDFGTLGSAELRSAIKVFNNDTVNTKIYLDDFTVTDLTSTDYIYYDDFATAYSYRYLQAEGTQTMTVNENVALVDTTGTASGYTVPVYATATADTSVLGNYNSKASLNGFDEPISFNWMVYKEQPAWSEDFGDYTTAGVAPSLSPWVAESDTTGKTVEADPKAGENKVLKYTTSSKQENWGKFSDGKSVSGNIVVSYRFMLPKTTATALFDVSVMSEDNDYPIIQAQIDMNANGARLISKLSSGNDTLIPRGSIAADTWHTIVYNIDTVNGTYTYSVDNGEESQERKCYASNLSFNNIRIAQRSGSIAEELTLYLDDIYVTELITEEEEPTSPWDYEIVAPVLKNSDSELVSDLVYGGSVSGVTIKKISDEDMAGDVYVAVYDETGVLIGANCEALVINGWSKGEEKTVDLSLSLSGIEEDEIDNCVLKAFVFDSKLAPLADVFTTAEAE